MTAPKAAPTRHRGQGRGQVSAPRWHPGDLGRAALGLVSGMLGLLVASWVLPGLNIGGFRGLLVTSVFLVLVGAVLRPAMVWLAARTGWFGALLVALGGQAIVVYVALVVDPVEHTDSFWTAFAASWIVAAVATVAAGFATAGTDEAVTAGLVREARRDRRTLADPDVEGIVFVQIDGLPYPVLNQAVLGGTLPTLSRWIRSGSHVLHEWRPMMPATTPVSQMGLLHGTTEGIPAFRWLVRETGEMLVANRPADAARIEAMHSNGKGLLADGGVSVSNLFTGDAPVAFATMSALGRGQRTRAAREPMARYLVRPEGFTRGITRTVSELVRERFDARRAIRQDIRPRVERGWGFAGERAGILGLIHDLNTALVSEAMLHGARSVYVDYVDYDAVAHHAGVLRRESLTALERVDAALGQLQKVAEVAPRRYRFVVVSDHGQAQGEIFADRYGEDLAAVVARLSSADVTAAVANPEAAGRLTGMMSDAASSESDGAVDRALQNASQRVVGDAYHGDEAAAHSAKQEAETFVVLGSGNLGLVYVTGEPRRLTRQVIADRWPDLVPGLVAHEGIAFAIVDDGERGPVVVGRSGERWLDSGEIRGDDPLEPFGPGAAEAVSHAAHMPEAPDIYVNSLVDRMGEVAAFEGLVGCHGGLGGWQDRAILVHPADLPAPTTQLLGADAVHRHFVSWLELLGHRQALPLADGGQVTSQSAQ